MEQYLLDEQVEQLAKVLENLETGMVQKQKLEDELKKIRKINRSNEEHLERAQARFKEELEKMRSRISGVNELLEKHKKKRDDLMKPGPDPEEVEHYKQIYRKLEEKYLKEKQRNDENKRKIEEMMKEEGSDRQERIQRAENLRPVCGVCETAYAARKNRVPRVLGCGHTICEACAFKLVAESAVPCPVCRDKTSLVNGEVGILPMNHALLEWIQKATV